MTGRKRTATDRAGLDQRTLDRFRGRMAGIEAHVPDPPLPAAGRHGEAGAMRTPRLDQREARQRNVYVLLVVAVLGLVVVLLPYVGRPRPAVELQPAAPTPTAIAVAVASAAPSPTASPTPTPRSTPLICPQGPTLYEGPWFNYETWAGNDWAVIEGRLKATAARLAIIGTRGPFAGPERPVIWPDGYVQEPESERLALIDPAGRVLARDGDVVMLGGRLALDGEAWTACGIRVLRVARTR